MSTVRIDVARASTRWRSLRGADALARRAVRAALGGKKPMRRPIEVSVVLASDAKVRRLNARYRGQDKATNVLSFPAGDMEPSQPLLLGDVVLAFETIAREAVAQEKSLKDHFVHLVVHGVLHLLGHDHIRHADAVRMEGLETKILATLGISDPYGESPRRKPGRKAPR